MDGPDQVEDRRGAAQLVGHPATRHNQPVERGGVHVADRDIHADGQPVLPVDRAGSQADAGHAGAGLAQPHDRDPELQVLDALGGKDPDVHPIQHHGDLLEPRIRRHCRRSVTLSVHLFSESVRAARAFSRRAGVILFHG